MFRILHGDMRELGKQIGDNSIDYDIYGPTLRKKISSSLYGELAIFAQRVLKPGGSLVFFMGHFHEDEIKRLYS